MRGIRGGLEISLINLINLQVRIQGLGLNGSLMMSASGIRKQLNKEASAQTRERYPIRAKLTPGSRFQLLVSRPPSK